MENILHIFVPVLLILTFASALVIRVLRKKDSHESISSMAKTSENVHSNIVNNIGLFAILFSKYLYAISNFSQP